MTVGLRRNLLIIANKYVIKLVLIVVVMLFLILLVVFVLALPVAPGDVARAARRALAGRRQLSERRRPARQGLDRRR